MDTNTRKFHIVSAFSGVLLILCLLLSGFAFASEEETATTEEATTSAEQADALQETSEESTTPAAPAETTGAVSAPGEAFTDPGEYYIHCLTSPYVFLATPEVEAGDIPLYAGEGVDVSAWQGENGEGPVNNLQLEILGEELLPIEVRFDEEGFASFVIPQTGKVLGLAGGLRNGVNIMPVDPMPSYYPARGHGKLKEKKDGQRWLIENQPDGTCLIRSAADSHYVMTVDDRFGTQYANIMLWEETGADTQKFCFSTETPRLSSTLEAGPYFIRSGVSDWFLLSIGDGVYNDERDIYIWESDQGDGQMFSVEYDDYGFAIIHHNDSSKVLTVRENTARNGQAVGQYEYDGKPWQRWIIEEREDGGYNIRSALNVGEVLDLSNSSVRNGNPITLRWHNESSAQQWFFHTEPVPAPPYAEIMAAYAQSYSSDTGFLIMVDTTCNHLGVFQGSYQNWSELYFWDCVTGKAWTPTPLGEFTIYSHTWTFAGNEDSPAWYSVYYCSEFLPSYYIHSIIYYMGTFEVLDATMGVNASHGCIRLYSDNAEWIYNNVPSGTKIVIY